MKDKELRQVLHKAGIISYNFGSETYYDKIILGLQLIAYMISNGKE